MCMHAYAVATSCSKYLSSTMDGDFFFDTPRRTVFQETLENKKIRLVVMQNLFWERNSSHLLGSAPVISRAKQPDLTPGSTL